MISGAEARIHGRTLCPLRARKDGKPRSFTVAHGQRKTAQDLRKRRECAAGPLPSRLVMRVRFRPRAHSCMPGGAVRGCLSHLGRIAASGSAGLSVTALASGGLPCSGRLSVLTAAG
jgi:hypothetical protein